MSVLMSGFQSRCKQEWLGENYHSQMPTQANDLDLSNVANSRLMFRSEIHRRELTLLAQRQNLAGRVRVGSFEVDRELEKRIHNQTRELHDTYNSVYYR